MHWFDDLKFRHKLLVNFVATCGIFAAALVFGALRIGELSHSSSHFSHEAVPEMALVGKISTYRVRYRAASLEYLMLADDKRAAGLTRMAGLDKQLRSALDEYAQRSDNDAEQAQIVKVRQTVDAYKAAVDGVVAKGVDHEAATLSGIVADWNALALSAQAETEKLSEVARSHAATEGDAADKMGRMAVMTAWGSLAAALVCAALFFWWFSHSVLASLGRASDLVNKVAHGDLTDAKVRAGKDEIGQLVAAMEHMRGFLHGVVSRMRSQAQEVAATSEQVTRAAAHTQDACGQQSGAATGIAANVEELAVSVNHVADNTTQASHNAAETDVQAQHSAAALEGIVGEIQRIAQTVRAASGKIEELRTQSSEISQIVAVIQGIAEQTNLLALNAAIEAARAGEQGRGFAVVADEVRKLSERTAASIAEVNGMIGAIQSSTQEAVQAIEVGVVAVDQGVVLVNRAGEAVTQIRHQSHEVAGLVEAIALGLREQAAAANDVGRKVEQIAAQSDELHGSAEQTSAAAHRLDRVSTEMLAAVNHFKL
ncbi:MAG: methyl-accepting chemotaxis protein [Rhodocyclaceae bacterium]